VLPDGPEVSAEQKSRAAHAVLEIIAAAESEVSRSGFIREAAGCLRVPAAALEKDFQRLAARARAGAEGTQPGPAGPAATALAAGTPEQDLLIVCLHYERTAKALSSSLRHEWIDPSYPAGVLLNRFLNEFEHGSWPGRDHLDSLLETAEEKALVASLLFDAPRFDDPLKIVQEGWAKLRDRALLPRLREIELALANEPGNSKIDPNSLLIEKLNLLRQLRQPLILAIGE
jgi:DNA primase